MRDSVVSLPRVNGLHPLVSMQVHVAIDLIESKYFPDGFTAVRVVEATRTIDYQNGLYAQGRTKPGHIVTKSKGGLSYHNYGLAIDFALLYDKDHNGTFETFSWDTLKDFNIDGEKDWQSVVKYFQSLGWKWGGDFKSIPDAPHLEKSFGYNVHELYSLYLSKNFITGTQFVNIKPKV